MPRTKPHFFVRRTPSGQFRHTVHILRIPEKLDEQGQKHQPPVICWNDIPCKVETLSGRQIEQARSLYQNADYRVTMDYIEGVRETHRLRLIPSGVELHIGHVSNTDLENVELVLLCSEVR